MVREQKHERETEKKSQDEAVTKLRRNQDEAMMKPIRSRGEAKMKQRKIQPPEAARKYGYPQH